MKKVTSEQLAERIRQSFRTLDTDGLQALMKAMSPIDSLEEVATRLADPAWSRLAVRDLDGAALVGLRVLARLPHGALVREIDLLGRLVAPQAANARPPSAQLVQSGAAVMYRDPYRRSREVRLRVIGPLRERWVTLTTEPEDKVVVPEPSEAEERHRVQRAEFELGVLLAAVEHARPRATRLRDMHRGDEKTILELVSTVCGGQEHAHDRLNMLMRRGLLTPQEGRLALDPAALEEWKDPLLRLLLDRIAERRHSTAWRVAFAGLVSAKGWISMQRLVEMTAQAALQQTYNYEPVKNALAECADVARLPAVINQRVGDTVYVRLTSAARRLLDDQPSISSAHAAGLLVQPNLQLMVQPGVPLEVIARLGSFARLVSADQVAVFALDEQATRRAAAEGWTSSELLTLLEKHASLGVPSTVARALSDWSRSKAQATLARGLVALLNLPYEEVARIAGRIPVEKIAEGVFRVDDEVGDAFVLALRKAGVACRSFTPQRAGDEHEEEEETTPADRYRSLHDFLTQAESDLQRTRHVPSD